MRLRSLLLRWLLVPTLAVWALGFAVGYTRSLAQANEAYDRTLLGSALVIGERLTLVEGDVVADLPQAALEMLRTDAQFVTGIGTALLESQCPSSQSWAWRRANVFHPRKPHDIV